METSDILAKEREMAALPNQGGWLCADVDSRSTVSARLRSLRSRARSSRKNAVVSRRLRDGRISHACRAGTFEPQL